MENHFHKGSQRTKQFLDLKKKKVSQSATLICLDSNLLVTRSLLEFLIRTKLIKIFIAWKRKLYMNIKIYYTYAYI